MKISWGRNVKNRGKKKDFSQYYFCDIILKKRKKYVSYIRVFYVKNVIITRFKLTII